MNRSRPLKVVAAVFRTDELRMFIWNQMDDSSKAAFKMVSKKMFRRIRRYVYDVVYKIATANGVRSETYSWAPLLSLQNVIISTFRWDNHNKITIPTLIWQDSLFKEARRIHIVEHSERRSLILPRFHIPVVSYRGTVRGLIWFLRTRETPYRSVDHLRNWDGLQGREIEAALALKTLKLGVERSDVLKKRTELVKMLYLSNAKLDWLVSKPGSIRATISILKSIPAARIVISIDDHVKILEWVNRKDVYTKTLFDDFCKNIHSVRYLAVESIGDIVRAIAVEPLRIAEQIAMKSGWSLLWSKGRSCTTRSYSADVLRRLYRRVIRFSLLPDKLGSWCRIAFFVLAYTKQKTPSTERLKLASLLRCRLSSFPIRGDFASGYCASVARTMLFSCSGEHERGCVIAWLAQGISAYPEILAYMKRFKWKRYLPLIKEIYGSPANL